MRTSVIIASLLLVFSSLAQARSDTLMRIHGSNTIGATLAPALVKEWLSSRGFNDFDIIETKSQEKQLLATSPLGERLAVEIHAHGSSTSFKSLAREKADIGMSSRPIKEKEKRLLAALGNFDRPESEYVVGLDGIAVIVHPKNPLAQIDLKTLKGVFSGRLNNWSQLGQTAAPIQLYARDDKSGTYDTFKSLVLGKKSPLGAGAKRFESNAELSRQVSHDVNGIGFVGLPYILQSKALKVAASENSAYLSPTDFTVSTEDYALARRLYMYFPNENIHPYAEDFLHFVVSGRGQRQVAETGFVSQTIHAVETKLPSEVPEEYYQLTRGAQRLSVNFRFRRGLAELDSKATRDVERLIRFMRRAENQDRRLLLFGFSDTDEGIPLQRLSLSIERADYVADVLMRRNIVPKKIRGYGQALTVAADESQTGREKNRRVEVWLK